MRFLTTKIYLVIFVFAVYGISCRAQEFNSGIKYKKELLNDLNGAIKFQIRSEIGSANTYYSNLQPALQYCVSKHISISGAFRYSAGITHKEEGRSDYFDKYRFTTDLNYKTKRFDNEVKFTTRLRYQYAIKDEKVKTYIRNKIGCDYKLSGKANAYLAFEPYYSVDKKEMDTFRTYLGCEFELIKNEIEVFLILESNLKKMNMTANQIIGFAYKL